MHTAVQCFVLVARQHGVDLSVERIVHDYALDGEPNTTRLLRIAKDQGLKAQARRLTWHKLTRVGGAFPVLARLKNGNTVIFAGFRGQDEPPHVLVLDPLADKAELLKIDREKLENVWDGEVIFLKRDHSITDEDQPFRLRWFLPEVLRQRPLFVQVAIAALLLHVLALSVPIFFQITLDKVISNESYDTLYVLGIGVLLALTFNAIIEYLRGLLLLHATSKIDIRVATRTFKKLLSLPVDFFRHRSAGVLTKHMQQTASIREFLTGRLFLTVLDATALIVYVPILFFYSPTLTYVVLGFAGVISAITLLVMGPYRRRLKALYQAEGDRQSLLVETIGGMETVKALAIEPIKRREWDDTAAKAVAMHMGVGKISTLVRSLTGYLEKLMVVAIIWIGSLLVFSGDVTIGALIAFNILAGRVSSPLVALVRLINEFQQANLSVKMLGEVMNQRPERVSTGGLAPRFKGAIAFDDVTFRYRPDGPPILDRVSFAIAPGEVVGIVGRSGSGKSTITRLIQGLYPAQSGIVRIDGTDIRELDLAHLRMNIGVVLQESFLFRGPVRENISATQPNASFAEVVAAAKLAGAEEFIQRLPQGYDTVLEEGATNLSGGQKQRIAIARALLRQPRFLIMDEATSALDPESEAIVQTNLGRIAAERTVVIVSHRLTTLTGVDKIIVIEDGRIVDAAPHKVLVQRCEIYRRLWFQQNPHLAEESLAAE